MPAIAWSTLLTLVLLWPLRHGGFPLARDMVFTPDPPLTWTSVGLGSAPPRAVPVDALVSLWSSLVGGVVISRIALFVPLVLAGVGVAALLGRGRAMPAAVASGFAIWNPYVIERLAMGNWSLLWAYAALPWIVRACVRLRAGAGWGPVVLWAAAASITPTGGLLALTTVAVCAWPGRGRGARRRWLTPLGLTVALQLPWIVPGLVGPARATSDPAGVDAFAARAEHGGGVLLSLLGGGGAWNADAAPASRTGWFGWLTLALVTAILVSGIGPARVVLGASTVYRMTWCAVAGVLLAAAASLPGGDALLEWLVREVPGAGIVRDAQKWLAPYLVLLAVMAGCAATRFAVLGAARYGAYVAGAVLPVLLLPDAVSTLRPVLTPIHYPRDWRWAAATVGDSGTVLALPFQPYRSFPWAPGRPVLDPAPRLLPGDVVVSDRLTVSGRTLRGEDERAARIQDALDDPRRLARALAGNGISWVLVETDTPGVVPDLNGLQQVRSGSGLALYRVPGPVSPSGPTRTQQAGVLAADLIALLGLAAGVVMIVRRRHG